MKLARAAGALALVLVASAACASGPVPVPVGPDPAEVAALRAAAARVGPLEARVAALETERDALRARVRVLEQRAGVRAFETEALVAGAGRVILPEAQRVEAREEGPRRARLSREVAASRGGTVIAYWATWCKPCIAPEELELLRELRAQLAREGVGFVSMAIDGLDRVLGHDRAGEWLYPLWQRDQGHLDMLPEALLRGADVSMPLFLVVTAKAELRWYRAEQLTPEAVDDLVTAAILMGRPAR